MSIITNIRQFLQQTSILFKNKTRNYKLTTSIIIQFIIIITIISSCKSKNHIDKYDVNIDSLKTLPDNFYAYRGGRIYLEDLIVENYRIWFNLNNLGNIQNTFRIQDFKDKKSNITTTIKTYGIDTLASKKNAQKFIDLSRKYKFGHIGIERNGKIFFSYKDGLAEQYVKALNDSTKSIYLKNKDFKLLENGWFENVRK